MSGIDYSKWDNLDEYSDDDNDDDDNDGDIGNGDDGRLSSSSMTPRVTRLDGPSKVTFGGSSSSTTTTSLINIEPTSSSSSSSDDKISTAVTAATTKLSLTSNNDENIASSSWTERGGLVISESATIIDGNPQKRKLYWSQDRYSVTFRLELLLHGHNNNGEKEEEKQEKIQSVDVNGILPYSDRFCATASTRPILHCQGIITNTNNNNKIIGVNNNNNNNNIDPNNLVLLLEGELPHPVYIAEDDDDADWSVVQDNYNRRFLMITLYKAVPMHGLFVWWRRPMMEFPELDLQQVKDDPTTTAAASSSSAAGSTTTAPAAPQDFLKSWEEAHKIFREEKMKKKKIIV